MFLIYTSPGSNPSQNPTINVVPDLSAASGIRAAYRNHSAKVPREKISASVIRRRGAKQNKKRACSENSRQTPWKSAANPCSEQGTFPFNRLIISQNKVLCKGYFANFSILYYPPFRIHQNFAQKKQTNRQTRLVNLLFFIGFFHNRLYSFLKILPGQKNISATV